MTQATITLPNSAYTGDTTIARWAPSVGSYPSLGTNLSLNSAEIFLKQFFMRQGVPFLGQFGFDIAASQAEAPVANVRRDFTDQMEMHGIITCVASDGETLVVTDINDSEEPYIWTPPNSTEVIAFANHVHDLGAGNRSLTITFNDNARQVRINKGGIVRDGLISIKKGTVLIPAVRISIKKGTELRTLI